MSAFKVDGIFTVAAATGKPVFSYPIAGDSTAYVIEQNFIIYLANYVAPVLGSAHATYTAAFCTGDTSMQDLGAGVCRYTRQWASVPATRNDFASFAYRFPGLMGNLFPPYNQYWNADPGGGRDPRIETVNSRIQNDYFLCKPGETYETPQDIPVIEAQQYTLVANNEARIDYLLPAGILWGDSLPTKEDYQAMIGTDEIVAEDSTLERYLGLIYVRRTRYVKAL